MAKVLKRKTGDAKSLDTLLADSQTTKIKKALAANIDELGMVELILAPFAETIKKHALLKEKVKTDMIKLKLGHAKGKTFETERLITNCRVIDMAKLKAAVDVEPYMVDGTRNTLKTRKINDGQS